MLFSFLQLALQAEGPDGPRLKLALGVMTAKPEMHHLSLRLLPDQAPDNYAPSEEARLERVLKAAPGVDKVKHIKKHNRGGYIVSADVSREAIGAILESVSAQGFRPVI